MPSPNISTFREVVPFIYSWTTPDIPKYDGWEKIGYTEQESADKRIAQARAEERRAMAVAREQEMSAAVMENRAKVVLAEAEVPKAMAEAFRSGNFGSMDYQRLRNIEADTSMRNSLSGKDQQKDKNDS